MTKRDQLLNLIHSPMPNATIPAAFFLHFDPAYHKGQAAIDKHLEFFNATGMDFVKIQYEQTLPAFSVHHPIDWANVPLYPPEFYGPPVRVVEGLVKAAGQEALVVLTVYSPFMQLAHLADDGILDTHFKENPEVVARGLATMTENVLTLVRACKRVGVDGFYVSTQGGETFRPFGPDIFRQYIKPGDLAIWNEIRDCPFNILHVCDYNGSYSDLSPFLDYPGHVVNASLHVGDRILSPSDLSTMFNRPFMGGIERTGTISTGTPDEVRHAVRNVLAYASDRFILGADCTVLADTPWENLKVAIETAHQYRRG